MKKIRVHCLDGYYYVEDGYLCYSCPDLQDDVDKTIDTIQQANDSKRQSMRSILADIWKMNEGKSPFEKDEGFASDAQRRAAFASGYKAKGKKGKKEEIEKSDKTMTGKKPTKVEIEIEILVGKR